MNREKIAKIFGDEWVDFMAGFVDTPDFDNILVELKKQKDAGAIIYPEQPQIFRAFKEVPLSKVRVVLIGQDPYPAEGYPNGLAFAHSETKKVAASMEKIIDAIEKDAYSGLNFDKPNFDTELKSWPAQGILMLNSALTVVAKTPGSHKEIWHPFTSYVIDTLSKITRDLIFLAWGKDASTYIEHINFMRHYSFSAEHPSFAAREKRDWNCKHFSLVNATITTNKLGERIKW